ncbi:MAG: cob(I)yrinic acid a,c-diamide adenosyltransferase [Pseudomonadota bacterium]
MGNRLTKIYTRTGDKGTTGLGDGSRVPKDDPRVEAYGCADELNSHVGALLAVTNLPERVVETLTDVQHDLFDLGGELCLPGYTAMTQAHVDRLEHVLDDLNEELPPLKDFILPGGGPAAAAAHVARTVCRRTERRIWTLARDADVNPLLLTYLNRLSDLMFVIARTLARHERGGDVLWCRDRT